MVRAPVDGYTLLLAPAAGAVNATLYDNLPFNFIRDIAPVAGIVGVPLVMVVNPAFPARSVPDFITYVKTNPGKVSFASSGSGTLLHVAAELFKMMAGVNMIHVPYRGTAPALTDLLSGQVQVVFADMATSIDHVMAGRLRALAVTTATRSPVLPNIATLSEYLPSIQVSSWYGIGAPRNTPTEIVDKLNREINAGLAETRLKGRFTELGLIMLPGSPADFGHLIAEDIEKWGKVIRAANIRAE